jgi:hypothetical protein
MTNLMNLTPELVGALNKLHQDHHQDLLQIKEHLTKIVVEKPNRKGYEHSYIATSDLLDIVNPIISKVELSLNTMLQGDDVVTVLSHPSGGYFISRTYISQPREGRDMDSIQFKMSRFTQTRRSMILGLLNIDDGVISDEDGNIAAGNYYGATRNDIQATKGEELVEAVEKKIAKFVPVQSKEGKK